MLCITADVMSLSPKGPGKRRRVSRETLADAARSSMKLRNLSIVAYATKSLNEQYTEHYNIQSKWSQFIYLNMLFI